MESDSSLLMRKEKFWLFVCATAVAFGCASCSTGDTLEQALSQSDTFVWVDFTELYNSPEQPVVVCDSAFAEIASHKLGVHIPKFTTGKENILVTPRKTVEKYPTSKINLCSAPNLRPAGKLRDVPQRFERNDTTWWLDSSETEKLDLFN